MNSKFNTKKSFFGLTKESNKAFTLVEMVIAVGIFAIVMVFAVGALLSVVGANRQAQAVKTLINNLDFALDNMTRTIRTGSNYDCDPSTPGVLDECSAIPGTSLALLDNQGRSIVYQLSGSTLTRSINGGAAVVMTAPEVVISRLNFYVNGVAAGSKLQPSVILVVGGQVVIKADVVSNFNVQTFAVQRLYNK